MQLLRIGDAHMRYGGPHAKDKTCDFPSSLSRKYKRKRLSRSAGLVRYETSRCLKTTYAPRRIIPTSPRGASRVRIGNSARHQSPPSAACANPSREGLWLTVREAPCHPDGGFCQIRTSSALLLDGGLWSRAAGGSAPKAVVGRGLRLPESRHSEPPTPPASSNNRSYPTLEADARCPDNGARRTGNVEDRRCAMA